VITQQLLAAVVRALDAEPSFAEVVMVNHKAAFLATHHRLRHVSLDTAAAQFYAEVTILQWAWRRPASLSMGLPVLALVKAPRSGARRN
jgi:hypothetical protein